LGLHQSEICEVLSIFVVNTKEMSMIVSASSNGVINVHEDDKLTETAIRRTILIPQNYHIQAVAVYQYGMGNQSMKFIIVALNKGYIKTFELETGRPDASYPAHREKVDVLDICTLRKKPFFFTSVSSGKIFMWIAPPCPNKYQRCYQFKNPHYQKA